MDPHGSAVVTQHCGTKLHLPTLNQRTSRAFRATNLNEEKAADSKLNNIALRKGVNLKAAS